MRKQRFRYLTAAAILVVLVVLPAAGGFAQEPVKHFENTIIGATLSPEAEESLSSLVHAALTEMDPDVGNYAIEAETEVLRNQNGEVLTCRTTATLRSIISKQGFLVRLSAEYSLLDGTWSILGYNPNFVPGVAAPEVVMSATEVGSIMAAKEALESSLGTDQSKGVSDARVVAMAPISGECSPAKWTSKRIVGKFRAGGWRSDLYLAPNATEPTAWNYFMNGSRLLTWYSNSHGITSNYNGAPCTGLVYNGGNLMYNEFKAMSRWTGLVYNVTYVDGCNTYMNPLRRSIWNGHNLRTYVGGTRLMPFGASDAADEKFWTYVLTKGWTMSRALSRAMRDEGVVGYYAMQGYTGTYGPRPLRIELTWRARPRDLDVHLWLPSHSPYHLYSTNKGRTGAHPYARVDRDDTNGYGPENTVIVEAYTGTYRFAVYNYSNERSIRGSGARVKLYRGNKLIGSYTPPTSGNGRWWVVFDYYGQNGAIVRRNYLTSSYPGAYSAPAEMSAASK